MKSVFALSSILALLAGCSAGSDANVTESMLVTPTSVLPDDWSSVTVTHGGGLLPPPPEGSMCDVLEKAYSIDRAARTLSWRFCVKDAESVWLEPTLPWRVETGVHTLGNDELADLEAAVREVTVAPPTNPCIWGDGPRTTLTITTATETKTYGDRELCGVSSPADGIEASLEALRALTSR